MASGNPNLTSGQLLPGFYGFVDYNLSGQAQPPNLRCLLWGFVGASATATPNMPFRPIDAADAVAKCGGSSTDLSRWYNAASAQPQSSGADIWLMPIVAPSGGVQSTYTLTVFLAATNPSKAGTIQLWIASQMIAAVGYTTTDTASTIATNLAAAITALSNGGGNVPLVSAIAASAVVTLTYFHKGTTGEDLPIRCVITPNGSGVSLSPAQALFATNATGAGSVVITVGAISVTTALVGGETPAQVATKVAASWNASTYPVTAVVDGTTPAQVDFYFNGNNSGYDVRRMTAAVVTTTGLTVNLGSGATSGTGSAASLSFNGTQGTGLPALATAITNLQTSQQWYRSWGTPWSDATSLGALATYIEAASNGSITGQKLQILATSDWQSLSVDGAIPPSVSPNLNTTPPHYTFGWAIDASVQTMELTARIAAAKAALWISTPQKNWNTFQFQGNAAAPILQPKNIPSFDTLNSALRTFALSPWIVGTSGNIEVVKGRTTSLAQDLRLWSWSAEAQAAYHIQDLANFFPTVFIAPGGGAPNLVRFTDPKAPGIYDAQSFIDVTQARMRLWERLGNYDGADLLASQVSAAPDPVNVNRMNVDFPESPVLDLDQIVFTSHFTQPSQ